MTIDIDPIEHLHYHQWATNRLLDAAAKLDVEPLQRNLGTAYGSIFGTLVHLYQADVIWFTRLLGDSPASVNGVAPEQGITKLTAEWALTQETLLGWAQKLGEQDWLRMVNYRTTAGDPYTHPVWRIILHLVNHGTLHRGQVMAMFRQVGAKPPGTDLMFYYREVESR